MALEKNLPLLFLGTLLLCIWAAQADGSHAIPPAVAVDCSSQMMNLADCLSFVTNGSTTTKPEGKCCSGLKTVLKSSPVCLCEGFKSSAQLGVVLNISKAMTLPKVCRLSAPPVNNCGLSTVTGAAPVAAPVAAPTSTASSPTVGSGSANEQTPLLVPGSSGAEVFSSISGIYLIASLVIACLYL